MLEFSRRVTGSGRSTVALLVLFCAGCGERSALDRAGISGLKPSSGWSATDPARFAVPGRAIASWTGPDGASLVAYGTIAAPRVSAQALLKEALVRFENLPEMRILESSTKKVGGVDAAYLEILAPGTGDELAPTGLGRPIAPEGKTLIPTKRISIGIPSPDRTIWLTWHCPESSSSTLKSEVESAIKDIKIQDRVSSSY